MRRNRFWIVALALASVCVFAGEALGGFEQYPFTYVWRSATMLNGGYAGDPVIVDLNQDSYPDVVVGSPDGYVTAFSGKDGSQLWQFGPVHKSQRGALMVEDVNGDGLPEIVFGDDQDTLYCVSGPFGSEVWHKEGYRLRNSVAFFDVNNDGRQDIIVAGREPAGAPQKLAAIDGVAGEIIWESPAIAWYKFNPVVCDIEGDGKYEVLTWLSGYINVANAADGTLKWNLTTIPGLEPGYEVQGLCLILDLNSDGVLDIISYAANSTDVKSNMVYAYTPDLEALATDMTAPVKFLWSKKGADYIGGDNEMTMGDLNGDGAYEFVHAQEVIKEMYNIICRRAVDGEVLWNVTMPGAWPYHQSFALGDYDNDGLPDVLVGSRGNRGDTPKATFNVFRGTDGRTLLSIDMDSQAAPLMADVNKDGLMEVIVNGVAYVEGTADDGSYVWALPTTTACDAGEIAWGSHLNSPTNVGVLPIVEGPAVAMGLVLLGCFARHRTSRA